jgi:transcriptional regulator of arginine metabolism
MTAASRDGSQKMGRTQRQHVITRLLAAHRVTNQEQLVELLAAEGVSSTQATVSRDLVDLGAIKVRAGDGDSTYAIPEQPHAQKAPDEHLRRIFGDWVVEVNATHNIVVLRTPPGSAHVVGSALDRADLPEVAGTVAGDDTLFVVVTDPEHPVTGPTAALAQRLRDLAGLNPLLANPPASPDQD